MYKIGDTVGKLTLLGKKKENNRTYFYCSCTCGRRKWIRADSLKSVRSCGCLARGTQFGPRDIEGRKFGKLIVIGASDKRDSRGAVLYKCKCDCGNIIYVAGRQLRNGHTKSCGCTRKEKFAKHIEDIKHNLVNRRFGRLTVIREIGVDKHRNIIWECRCDCGNTVSVIARSLIAGNTMSCGCISKEKLEEESKKNCIDGTNTAIISSLLKDNKSNITKSGVKGVGWDKKSNKWRAYIMFKRKHYHLGYFANLDDAIEAREKAEQKTFGEFLEWHNKFKDNKKEI